jgi:hypothetical protein
MFTQSVVEISRHICYNDATMSSILVKFLSRVAEEQVTTFVLFDSSLFVLGCCLSLTQMASHDFTCSADRPIERIERYISPCHPPPPVFILLTGCISLERVQGLPRIASHARFKDGGAGYHHY